MSEQGSRYHVGYEMARAHQSELRDVKAQDRLARQTGAARLPEPHPSGAALVRSLGARLSGRRQSPPRKAKVAATGGAPAAMS